MVVCSCIYCGAEIEIPEGLVFEGSLKAVIEYIDKLTIEKSDQCLCRQTLKEKIARGGSYELENGKLS